MGKQVFVDVKGIWPDLAQLAMYKKGIAFKQRSILPWRDLYFNYQLWNNRNIHLQLDTILELKQFKHMHVFEDNIFITFDSGMMQYKVDTLEGSLIEKISSKDGSKTMAVSFIDDTEEIVVECSGMTCVTPYGDILLLGYEDGEVRAYLQEKLLSTKEPLFTFNIKDLILDGFLDVAIKAIEVYEAKESHYLFIATQHQTIKVIVTYND
ncbi:hypothetical protein RR46_11182 [Papilio xuthus]|uniref:Uncharacterized protein n=1 Tax=Papilio xuthus TaxID=66420 RepID=A0A194PXJ2_PAPXU|nr:hypothetical protein RR46_11182 [Papilio xuthus]